jgi:thiol-disulfide isomerase/thioredoxin
MNIIRVLAATILAGSLSISIALFSQHWLESHPQLAPGTRVQAERIVTLPDLKLADLNGRYVGSHNWAGRVVILFYWATWCHSCPEMLTALAELQAQYGRGIVQVVAIAVDDPQIVAEWLTHYEYNDCFPVLIGDRQAVLLSKRLGNRVQGLPFLAVFDPLGRQLFHEVGVSDLKQLMQLLTKQLQQS